MTSEEKKLSLPESIQKEVARIREMITTTKALLPGGNVNFVVYEMLIKEAERSVREQDTVAMVRLLPKLQEAS